MSDAADGQPGGFESPPARTRPRLLRSVRARLTAWYALILAAMLLVLALGVHLVVRAGQRAEMQTEFERSISALEGVVRDQPEMLAFFDAHSTIDFFVVRRMPEETAALAEPPEPSAGAPAFSTTSTLPAAPPAAALPSPESLAPAAPTVYESARWRDESLNPEGFSARSLSQWPWTSPPPRSFRFETETVAAPTGHYELIVAQDAAPYERNLSRVTLYLFLASPLALLLAGVGGYFLAGRALSPVGVMASQAAQIHADRLSERLPIENPDDEFGRLAAAFNGTLARLEDSFERLRRFTADASHELRTPLTAIRAVGELGLAEPFDGNRCREAVASMLEEADRLARLVDGLLVLTRGDAAAAGARMLKSEPVALFDLAADVVDLLQVLAEEKGQQLLVDGDRSLIAAGDRSTLRQALVNLVDNAVRHTPPHGTISIRIARRLEDGRPSIEVRDQGPGIAAEHHDRIFDRFYRIDGEAGAEGAENVGANGCGLGLAIAKWAAEANRGGIELETHPGAGSTFRLFLGEAPTP